MAERRAGSPRPGAGPADRRLPAQSRREHRRQEAVDQIKAAARDLLAPHSSGELSLRAVARAVGIAPSGIYRYFGSRQELVAEVAGDAYRSVSRAVSDALGARPAEANREQALAMAHAYRAWALEHRAEFSLLFATQDPGDGAGLVSGDNVHPFFEWPIRLFHEGVRSGDVDLARATLSGRVALQPAFDLVWARDGIDVADREVAVLLSGWSALHGHVALELYGPLSWFHLSAHDDYDRHARGVLASMGYQPF